MADVTLHCGDSLQILRQLADASVDSIVTDPPYEIGLLSRAWDSSGIAFNVDLWREALRVLKPGGHLLAFSGPRTYHRTACAIEDAGFEIRDQGMWLHSQGFPKSKNLDGAWSGWGTALKPSHEPICIARKPLAKGMTVAANMLAHSTGAINVDGCRVGDEARVHLPAVGMGVLDQHSMPNTASAERRVVVGRWPANVIHDGSDEVAALFPVDAKTGHAARYYYCAKPNRADRGEGNTHATVKPSALMRHLCRLVTPPGGLVLDPFMGSGTTGVAARMEGMRFVGIDLLPEHVAIAERRIAGVEPEPEQLNLLKSA